MQSRKYWTKYCVTATVNDFVMSVPRSVQLIKKSPEPPDTNFCIFRRRRVLDIGEK